MRTPVAFLGLFCCTFFACAAVFVARDTGEHGHGPWPDPAIERGNDAGAFPGGSLPDAGWEPDLGPPDLGEPDLGPPDAGEPDLGEPDLGPPDAGEPDLGPPDAGEPDLGPEDAGSGGGTFACNDGVDNDGDGLVDLEGGDLDCTSFTADSEAASADEDAVTPGVQNDGWTIFSATGSSKTCFADSNYSGTESGTEAQPYNSVGECITALGTASGAHDFLFLKTGGSYGSLGSLRAGSSINGVMVVAPYGPQAGARPIITPLSWLSGGHDYTAILGVDVNIPSGPQTAFSLTGQDFFWIEDVRAGSPLGNTNGGGINTVSNRPLIMAHNMMGTDTGMGLGFEQCTWGFYHHNFVSGTGGGFSHGIYGSRDHESSPSGFNWLQCQSKVVDHRNNFWGNTGASASGGVGIRCRGGCMVQNQFIYDFTLPNYEMTQCKDNGSTSGTGVCDDDAACGVCVPMATAIDVTVAAGGRATTPNAIDWKGDQFPRNGAGWGDPYVGHHNVLGFGVGNGFRPTSFDSAGDPTLDFSAGERTSYAEEPAGGGLDLIELYMQDVLDVSSPNGLNIDLTCRDLWKWRDHDKRCTADCMNAFARLVADEEDGDGYTSAADASKWDTGAYTCDGLGDDSGTQWWADTTGVIAYPTGNLGSAGASEVYQPGAPSVLANDTLFAATGSHQCNDGYDNDGDGNIDYETGRMPWVTAPSDDGCSSLADNTEDSEGGGGGDAGPPDSGPADAGEPDLGPPDAGEPDAGPADAGAPPSAPALLSTTSIGATGGTSVSLSMAGVDQVTCAFGAYRSDTTAPVVTGATLGGEACTVVAQTDRSSGADYISTDTWTMAMVFCDGAAVSARANDTFAVSGTNLSFEQTVCLGWTGVSAVLNGAADSVGPDYGGDWAGDHTMTINTGINSVVLAMCNTEGEGVTGGTGTTVVEAGTGFTVHGYATDSGSGGNNSVILNATQISGRNYSCVKAELEP